jgi:hypothetical protein
MSQYDSQYSTYGVTEPVMEIPGILTKFGSGGRRDTTINLMALRMSI